MKISTKGRYGLRLMIELAKNFDKGPVLLKDIAKNQNISLKYLEQIIIPLKNSGLVISKRGKRGGYTLTKSPEKVSLSEIISVLEGEMNIVDCVKFPEICNNSKKCLSKKIWDEINMKIEDILKSHTLKDLIEIEEGELKCN